MRATNRLSAMMIKNCSPGKYADGGGLWLHKRAEGGAQWFLRVTVAGQRREMGLGSLMGVSLKEARSRAERWRKVAAEGRDPIQERDRLKRAAAVGGTRRPPTSDRQTATVAVCMPLCVL